MTESDLILSSSFLTCHTLVHMSYLRLKAYRCYRKQSSLCISCLEMLRYLMDVYYMVIDSEIF